MSRPFHVHKSFRTNHLSQTEGGVEVTITDNKGKVKIYDNIKFPKAFIAKSIAKDKTIVKIEYAGNIVYEI